MQSQAFRLGVWTAVAGLMLGAGAVERAAAQKGAPGPYAPIITELRQTRELLNQANHDYDGYRAKAVHQVTKAIHVLHPPAKTKPKTGTPKPPAPPQPPVKEDQAKSDAQLAQAAKQLQVILSQLQSLPAADARAVQAVPHVQAAINDIQTALKIR